VNHRFSCRKESDDIKTAVLLKDYGTSSDGTCLRAERYPALGGLSSGEAIIRNMGTFGVDGNGEATSGMNHKGESTEATPKGRNTP